MSYQDDEEVKVADFNGEEEGADADVEDALLDDPILEDELLIEDDIIAEEDELSEEFAGLDGSNTDY
jgi:hypothetical protein